MEMEIGVWRNLPDEIALNIIARLLPRRTHVRLATVWKEWNEMLSSYAAMQRIYPNIHHSCSSLFLFQAIVNWTRYTWVLEGNGDFYLLSDHYIFSDHSYQIDIACSTMFCLSEKYKYGNNFYICDEERRAWIRIPPYDISPSFHGKAFDSSTEQFIMVVGDYPDRVKVYDSSSRSWDTFELSFGDIVEYSVSGRGVYYRGKFYWLDNESCNGGVVELNLSEKRWTKIPPPKEYTYQNFENRIFYGFPTKFLELAGSDVGQLVLVDKNCGVMWKLENGGENINSKRWCRVDICLPKKIKHVSVNNSGWTVVVSKEGINIYDGSRRLVRKFAMDEVDHKLASANIDNISVLPFEGTYIWWPW